MIAAVRLLFEPCLADDAPGLWLLEDDAFVGALLNSCVEGDLLPEEKPRFVSLLRQGYSKHYVLAAVANHFNKRFRPGKLPGVRRRLGRYRLGRWPILGFVIRRVFNLPGESITERRLRVVENQLYLLAKMAHGQVDSQSLPIAAPWGGLHRLPLLRDLVELESKLDPAAKATYAALLDAAYGPQQGSFDRGAE